MRNKSALVSRPLLKWTTSSIFLPLDEGGLRWGWTYRKKAQRKAEGFMALSVFAFSFDVTGAAPGHGFNAENAEGLLKGIW
jgi:hypothetical protein